MDGPNEKDYKEIISFLKITKSILSDIVHDPIKYLRNEFYENEEIIYAMQKSWDEVVKSLESTIKDIKNKWHLKTTQKNLRESGLLGLQ
jgi:hypothetical protein